MSATKTQQTKLISNIEKEEALCENLTGIAHDLKLTQPMVAKLIRTQLSTYKKWLMNGKIPYRPNDPQYEAVLNFLRLAYNLEAMFQNPNDERVWLISKHETFQKSPLEYAAESMENLIAVRQYTDFVRGLGA